MRITRIDASSFRLPATRPLPLPTNGAPPAKAVECHAVIVQVHTDTGLIGIGFGPFTDGVRATVASIENDLAPLLGAADPLLHERLFAMSRTLQAPASSAYALIDIALWDLKAKAAGLPLWRLLGGARDRAPVHCGDTAAPGLAADEVIDLARTALAQGMMGIRVGIGGGDPEADARKVQSVRDALGEEIWFAISAQGRYDYETALPMGRFIEEEIGADWFEDPLPEHDLESYSRLSQRIDTPLAAGSRFAHPGLFARLLETGARVTLRPDVLRLGGITPFLKVAALAEILHRPLVPHLLPEIGVHLACGLAAVQAVDFSWRLAALFPQSSGIADGLIAPPETPGHGWQLNPDLLSRLTSAG